MLRARANVAISYVASADKAAITAEVAQLCSEISKIGGFDVMFPAPFFNEFVVRTPGPAAEVIKRLLEKKIIGGVALKRYYAEMSDSMLVCVTETAKKEAIDRLVDALSEI